MQGAVRRGRRRYRYYRLTKLAVITPSIVNAIAEGSLSSGTNLLMDGRIALPLSWSDQEQLFTD